MKKNIWHAVEGHEELLVGQYIVPNFVSNSMALKVSDNEYVLMSPGAPLLAPWKAQHPNDIKLHIIFPNAYHHMGVLDWLATYPNATLYASELAISQLKEKGFAEHTILALEQTQPPLPERYDVLFPPGHKAGDIWVRKQNLMGYKNSATSTWITCDSFLNYDRVSNQPIARIMQKLLGAAPGLKISQVVKWFILDNRKTFKSWVMKQLDQDQPTTLIPSHGEIRYDPLLASRIRKLINNRL